MRNRLAAEEIEDSKVLGIYFNGSRGDKNFYVSLDVEGRENAVFKFRNPANALNFFRSTSTNSPYGYSIPIHTSSLDYADEGKIVEYGHIGMWAYEHAMEEIKKYIKSQHSFSYN